MFISTIIGGGLDFFDALLPPPPFQPVTRQNLVLNEHIVEHIYNNKIKYIKSYNTDINNSLIKYNNTSTNYDYCIIATGYESKIKFMNMETIPKLYRHIIHPEVPNCAFIGFAASFNWVQVSELQIQWYLEYLNQNVKNVTSEDMVNKIQYDINNVSNLSYDYHDIATLTYEYCDSLASDINYKIKYSKFNPKYWTKSPENDLWSYRN